MKKRYISEEMNLLVKGHENFEFVDVAINCDNRLFIDPCLLELAKTEWSIEASHKINSFMNELIEAYVQKDDKKKLALLCHAREQNATKFGYGNGYNGKGNTVEGLLENFHPLEELVRAIKSIQQVQDITILLPGFAEDGLSDLITNILHLELSEFTDIQIKKLGKQSNGFVEFFYWDSEKLAWDKVRKPGYFVNEKEFLLVPKNIVRKKYLFGTGQYFSRIILEKMRDEYIDNDGKTLSKKDIVKAKRFSGEHWLYEEAIRFTTINNEALNEYHDKMLDFYVENGGAMTDDELDEVIYGDFITLSA